MDEIELVEPRAISANHSEWLYFRERGPEGKRQIDLVLVYEVPSAKRMSEMKGDERQREEVKAEKRRLFESNLRKAGVDLEREDAVADKVLQSAHIFICFPRSSQMCCQYSVCVYIQLVLYYPSSSFRNNRDKVTQYLIFLMLGISFRSSILKFYFVTSKRRGVENSYNGRELNDGNR